MSLLRSYDAFLFANASQITAVESSLRSLAFFLPGRFKDAELCVAERRATGRVGLALTLQSPAVQLRLVSLT